MKVSVALTTYNGELYLDEQLTSILNQTILPDEVIISDDNSTDRTDEIISLFKEKAPFNVIVLKNNNRGFNSNFQNALMRASGDIIFIADQDDVWFKNKIEKIILYFNSHPEIYLVIHDIEFCNSELIPIGETKIERYILNKQSVFEYVTGMATVVRKDFLTSCFPFPDHTNYDTWIHACANILNVKGIFYEVLALYRRHLENATKESIINLPYKSNKYKRFKDKINNRSKTGLANLLKINNSLLMYIDSIKSNLFLSHKYTNKLKEEIQIKSDILDYRIKLLDQSALKRCQMSILFYKNGGYKHFAGIKSMIKDIFYSN
jgi:glycosyltransferase involved in cell wall biosynthesis